MTRVRRWLARVPLFFPVAGCLAGVLVADLGGVGWLSLLPILPGLLFGLAGRGRLAAGCLAWALFGTLHGLRLDRQEEAADWVAQRAHEELALAGTVTSLRDRDGFLPRATLRVETVERGGQALPGAVLAVRGLPEDVRPGDRLRLRGRLRMPAVPRNPGEFDRRGWLRARGLAAEFSVREVEATGPPARAWALHRWAWERRLALRESLVRGLDEEGRSAALIRGLVLGDRSGGGVEVYGAFRKSGTMHVFAVSGLHVGLVGLLAGGALWLFRVPRSSAIWLVLAAVWSYALVTGLRPPALRASLMASVFLLGFALKRRPAVANSLLASVPLVLLLDSFQLQQAGFQLSYVVVGMIILVAPVLYRWLHPLVQCDPFLPKPLRTRWQSWALSGREKVLGLFTVSLAAWLGSMPLIAGHFGLVTPSAVIASVVLIPLVFVMLALAFLGVGLGLVAESLEASVNRMNGLLAGGAYSLARQFSELPGSHLELRRRDHWHDGLLVFDLWGGDGAVYCGAGDGILLDAGGEDEFHRAVRPALRSAGVDVRSLVLTHPDGGHVGGMRPAIEHYAPRQMLLPVAEASSQTFREAVALARERQCRVLRGQAGRRYPLGDGAQLEVLRVARGTAGRADDRGMVLRIHWDGWRILVSGDAGFSIERELLAAGVDVSADLWVMGRHGEDLTGSIDFVRAVSPRAIVVSDPAFPEQERVPDWWRTMVDGLGIELWRQRETGAVAVEVAPSHLTLRSFVNPHRVQVLKPVSVR